MKITKTSILILILAACGCSQQVNQCAHFSSKYPRIRLSPAELSEVALDLPAIKRSIASIAECYPKSAYMGIHNKIEIREALRHNGNEYFVIAQLDGVSELILVFKVNSQGRIIGSYQSSMAWRGNKGQ